MKRSIKWVGLGCIITGLVASLVGCGNAPTSPSSAAAATSSSAPAASAAAKTASTQPGENSKAVGFIFVGSEKDYGYNEAAYKGSLAVEKAFPKLKILRAENVPETADVQKVEEDMIKKGAKIIFATSFGYLQPTLKIASKYPDVMFLWQGAGGSTAPNISKLYGYSWQAEYLAGIAAGKVTKTNKLGFVGGFPIPDIMLDVNAFELGAQSVNPAVTTKVVFTNSWADPSAQSTAADTLINAGVDVIAQHEDATSTIIEAANKAGVMSVGYHFDASSLAPKTWLTGPTWNWNDLYVNLVKLTESGNLKSSKYYGSYNGSMADGVVRLAPFGSSVPKDVQQLVLSKEALLKQGKLNPFEGPIEDQKGKVVIAKSAAPTADQLNSVNYFVKGVIGSTGGK